MNALKTLTMSALLLNSVVAYGQDIPNTFTPDTPANAADVNENFVHVVDRLKGLENASMGYLMRDGEIQLNVDCTDNPAELNEVYADWWRLRELNFAIVGDCYGDITIMREVDENDEWTGATFQPAGQTIHISAAQGETAGIIPNDLTQKAGLYGGFGGGLYLVDLTITLGSSSDIGALYSRNGHGTLQNVTINGSELSQGTGVRVQEGAQVYMLNVNIANVSSGIQAINNGVIRFFYDSSVTSTERAFYATGGSTTRVQGGTITLSGSEYALNLKGNSTWRDGNLVISQGPVEVISGSVLDVDTVDAANSELSVVRGTVEASNLTLDHFTVNSSDVIFRDGAITSPSSIFLGSRAQFEDVDFINQLVVDYGSSAFLTNGTVDSMVVSNNSTTKVDSVTFTNDFFVINNSTSQLLGVTANSNVWTTQGSFNTLDNTSVTNTLFVLNGGRITVNGDTKPLATQISCVHGYADYVGLSMLDDAPATECLTTEDARDLQRIVVDLRNAANE